MISDISRDTHHRALSSFPFTKFVLQYARVTGNGYPDGAGPGENSAKDLPAVPGQTGAVTEKWK